MGSFARASILVAPAALLAAHAAPATRLGRSTLFPVTTRIRANNAVALTFDDGPDRHLDLFLTLLGEAEAHATFFVVGEQVERDPRKLQEIVSCGHQIAVHCYRHRSHLLLAPSQVVEDMRRAKDVIEEAAQCPTQLFRPPYGRFSLTSWLEASRQGWERVLYSRLGRDWDARATPQSITDEIGWPKAGDILLLHDSDRYAASGSWRNTLGALPTILERLSASGLVARSIGDLWDAGDVR